MIEFMSNNPGWTFLYIFIICCVIESVFKIMKGKE